MSTRTTRSRVTFSRPFYLSGVEETLPAGEYTVETDEELIEGITFTAYRRVLSVIHLPAISRKSKTGRVVTIDPSELDAALERDKTLRDRFTNSSSSGGPVVGTRPRLFRE